MLQLRKPAVPSHCWSMSGYLKSSLKDLGPRLWRQWMNRILHTDGDRKTGSHFEVQIIWQQLLEFLKNNEKDLCRIFILFCSVFISHGRVRAGSTAWTAQPDLEGLVTAKKAVLWIWVILFVSNGSNSKEKKSYTCRQTKFCLYDKYTWSNIIIKNHLEIIYSYWNNLLYSDDLLEFK